MINLRKTLATFSFVTFVLVVISSTVSAKTPGTFNPQVSFTFDDGYLSTLQNAQPILTANEMTATVYIVPAYVAQTGFMNWAQIQKLQNSYGWEIGSHSKTHAELPKLTKTQITSELNQSLNQLKNQGLNVKTLASPYGAYDNKTLIIARRLYDAHRGFWDRDTLNVIPYNTTIIRVQSVESSTTLSQVQAWVDQAKTNGDWLVLVFHEVLPSLVTGDDYITTTADFSAIVNYVKQSEVPVVKVANAILPKNTNLISNGDFDTDPFTSGWQRDYVNTTLYNQLNNGSTPSPKTSVILKSSTGHPTHLYAPLVTLDNPTATYAFTSFVSADTFKAGEFGFYVDEYDTGDNWISGKWLGLVNFNNVTTFGATYTPTSLNVSKIRLQAYLTTGAKGSVYVDSFHLELIDPGTPVTPTETPTPTLTEIPTPTATITPSVVPTFTPTPSPTNTPAVTPTPTKTPTPTPTIVNLLTNPKFELLDLAGWAIDWIKSGTGISIGNHPTNGTKSLIMASTGTAHHVFSKNIPVTFGTNFAWNQDLVSQNLTDEFGFYIDEYDAGGDWISGQWLGEIHTSLTTARNLTYTPTSANVKSAGLQYYFIGNTGGTVYVDNVVFGIK